MNRAVRMTRNCIEPWRSVQFNAAGHVLPCCSGTITGDFGHIQRDLLCKDAEGTHAPLFENNAYRELRGGLLTGDLCSSCKACRAVHEHDITADELRAKVVRYLESKGVKAAGTDLTRQYAFDECGGNVTNRCNFSCVYCAHSGVDGHRGELAAEMDRGDFLKVFDLLYSRGLRIFNFCGIGELTVYRDWQELCEEILEAYPQLRLRMISNFGKTLSDSELGTLARFDLVHISCDTLDEQTYAWLRKGGRLSVLLANVRRLLARLATLPQTHPKVVFNVTMSDAILGKLTELFRFAADHGLFVHLSSLFEMPGSIASQTKCLKKVWEVPESEIPGVRETILDLPRRMKAQNPVTGIWEYRFIHDQIASRADAITLNQFVPRSDETVYAAFYRLHARNQAAFLRKYWTSFDSHVRGIYLRGDTSAALTLPHARARLGYRVIGCAEGIDGNVRLRIGPEESVSIGRSLTLSASPSGPSSAVLLEVLSYEATFDDEPLRDELTMQVPCSDDSQDILIREMVAGGNEDAVADRLVQSQEPVAIWCAGLRALQVLARTRLGQANIQMVVDGDPAKQGSLFCGHTVCSPADIDRFTGTILVLHASCPERVESQIRQRGVTNRILIL